ncbi:hypothetical protein PENCOP_c003G01409 [Penicillium coprophilum]|uniref:FAD-binding PCMH-type domain-containing protein n=1 Tax=Penicillium coprophilum TaxID=36646 RepID=A0A1V6UZA6_9EURO|nr:hypothetical protein PENCOP_c003G01409 [Penicillium coprophilum]
MKRFLSHVAWGLALLQTLAAATAVPHYLQHEPITRRDLSVLTVSKELGRLLSKSSIIFGPQDPRWEDAVERYQTFAIPDVEIVVQPAAESDIPTIVKYCNKNSIAFMVVNRGHALTKTVGTFKGVQIDMASLRGLTIQPNKKSALFQGGTYGGQVIDTLWDQGYVTTTGSCACVGLLGPGLGGGHGRLEGQYGLISDNFISLNVVLASGEAIKVNANSHADLFWAMKGAGHNFGIVTSFEMKIYPRLVDTWHYHNYVWSEDKLETVFEELNKLHNNGNTPVLMAVNFGEFGLDTKISTTKAVLSWSFGYAGPAADAEKLLEPFNKIGSISEESGDVPYPEIPSIQGTGLDSDACVPNRTYALSTAGIQVYNITAERQIYEAFNAKIAQYPDLVLGARVTHEGYSNKAVRSVDPALSAFPLRDDYHLLYLAAVIPTGLTNVAIEWAHEIRDLWNAGQPQRRPSTYVNYAFGDEPLDSIYGYEPWRLQRLRALKGKYDPHNRFGFYNSFV